MYQQFLTSLKEINSGLNILEIVVSILVALVLGVVLLFIHKLTTDEFTYEKEFGVVLLFVPAVVALLISITGTNIARAFSIAGVLAIIRYRSEIMTPRDLAFIFFSVATGFAAGVKAYVIAVVFVIIGGIAMIIFTLLTADNGKNQKKTLRIAVPESIDATGLFDEVLSKYTTANRLTEVRTVSAGTVTELTYVIKLKDAKDTKAFMDEIRTLNANFKISLSEFATK